MIGKTLGHYRIEAKLGAGGMGEVYRAADTHLDRTVAVKVLPASALANPDRKKRFVQEAKAASALNHPNIVTIYDIDSEECDGRPTDFIAMEFVAGQTLDQLIGRKGLRVRDALRYAVQIADALSAAHAGGIVHRDLKPSNIMVTESGQVKVLDFGLAKLTDRAEPDAFAVTQELPADSAPLTEEGSILGTVAYMSPEQADGKKLDARSDIFTFGSVLHEMLTGRQAFAGSSKLSALSAILYREPDPVGASVPGVPEELERIIARCLRKDPERRWQTMADIKVALAEVLEEIDSSKTLPATKAVPPVRRPRDPRRWIWPALAGLLLGLLPGAYFAQRFLQSGPPTLLRLTFRRGDVTSARFAPGGMVVYSAEWDELPAALYSSRPGDREARELGLPSGRVLSISDSGEMALLLGGGPRGTLAQAPLGGGAPREILEDVWGADWSPDGRSLAVVHTVGGRHRVEYPIGTVLHETDSRPPYSPRVARDGKLVAFFDYDPEIGDYSVMIAGSGHPRQVLSRGWRGTGSLCWSPDGSEIWFSAASLGDPALHAVTLGGKLRVVSQAPGWIVLHDVAKDGQVLLAAVNSRLGILSRPPGATEDRNLAWLDASLAYEVSGDGRKMLFVELSYGEGRNSAIYIRGTDGSPAVRLGYGNRPALSPDGKWVLCIRREPNASQLLLLPTGPGVPRTLPGPSIIYEKVEWFPDSRRVLVTGSETGRPARTYAGDIDGGAFRAVTEEGVRASVVSPDGNRVLIADSGKLLERPVDGGRLSPLAELAPGEAPLRWSGDGRYVFLSRTEGGVLQLHQLDVTSGRKQLWRELRAPEPGAVFYGQVGLSADGLCYAASFQRDLANLYLARGLR